MSNRTWAIINTGLRWSLKPKCVNYASDHNYEIIHSYFTHFKSIRVSFFFSLRCEMFFFFSAKVRRSKRNAVLRRSSVGKNLSFVWKLWIEPAVPVDCQEAVIALIWCWIWRFRSRGEVSIPRSSSRFPHGLLPHGTERRRINDFEDTSLINNRFWPQGWLGAE